MTQWPRQRPCDGHRGFPQPSRSCDGAPFSRTANRQVRIDGDGTCIEPPQWHPRQVNQVAGRRDFLRVWVRGFPGRIE